MVYVGKSSVALIEAELNHGLMHELWHIITDTFDCQHPVQAKHVTNLKTHAFPLLDKYIDQNSRLISEAPLIKGIHDTQQLPILCLLSSVSSTKDK